MSQQTDRLTAALAGRYRIERHLGAGGMATVYLAEDLKHDRKVALKVLKPELAAVLGAERFVVEIKTTASLQHPHILPLFDSGTADGFLYYVMPFIEGETLRDKLNRETQLGVEEAVRITREVADALDYAHRRGVIHRDIKPENILLHDGRPMVADFGIALAVSAAAGGRMTETGLSLGTPHYMSPEQATADKEITARSDVYSLASVLYEALSGEPPHTGGSAQQVIMKIIAEPAQPVTALRKSVPPNVAAALAKALEKLPADRFDNARSFADALGNSAFMAGTTATVGIGGSPATSRMRDPVFLVMAGVTMLALVIMGTTLWKPRPSDLPVRATRVLLTMPPGQEYSSAAVGRQLRHFSISPDGNEIVYRSQGPTPNPGSAQLWLRQLDEFEATPIAATGAGTQQVRFSRDGAYLAFRRDDRLGVIPKEGGPIFWLTGPGGSPRWGDDGAVYYRSDSTIYRWRPGSATAEALPGVHTRRDVMDVLPGSAAVLLGSSGEMEVADLNTGVVRRLGAGGEAPRYLETGHIAFVRQEDGTLMVQSFDLSSLTTTGAAVATPDRVSSLSFDVARDGSLLYLAAGDQGTERLGWIDRSGSITPIDWIEPALFDAFSLSPKGTAIAAAISPSTARIATNDLWVYDLASRSRLPLTRDGKSARPRWHPNEPRVLFIRTDSAGVVLRTIASDGSGAGDSLTALPGLPADAIWTNDGKEILIRMPGTAARNIFRFVPGEHKTPVAFLNRSFQERNPAPSPDGKWLVYTSNQSDRDEVYAQPYPQGGAVVPVSIQGGFSPVWSRDGREVFYVGTDGYMWAAAITYDANAFRVTGRSRLFPTEAIVTDLHRPVFDVAPNGRFLARLRAPSGSREQLVLVRNWVQSVTGGK